MDVTQSAIFILVTHRAKLCKPGRATDRGTKERTNRRRHHHQSYTRFASSVRSVLYPSTISLPRLSWAHCSPVAGKWRRESKNPRRKPERHGDFSSNPATRLAWLEIGRNDPERSSERPRNLARERVLLDWKSFLLFRKFYMNPLVFHRVARVPTRNGLLSLFSVGS